jgi:hypothetical protein
MVAELIAAKALPEIAQTIAVRPDTAIIIAALVTSDFDRITALPHPDLNKTAPCEQDRAG